MDTNKKTFNYSVLFGIVYGVLVIVALIWIWWPKSSRVFEGSEKYTKVNVNQKSIDIYSIKLKKLLSKGDVDELYEKLSLDYISANNLTKDNYIKFLEERGFLANTIDIISSNVNIQDEGIYVYRFLYSNSNGNFYANVIETKPYEYTISFDQNQLPNLETTKELNSNLEVQEYSSDKITFIDNVKYSVRKKTIRDNGITYTLKITNNGNQEVRYKFDNITNVSVVFDDGKEAYLGGVVLTSDEDILTENGYLEKDLFFAVDIQDQNKIRYIKIKNVRIDDEKKNVKINV